MTPPSHRILLVEDDAAVRGLVAAHLRRGGFAVKEAESAEEVLRALRDGRLAYDLALADVHLPGLSGIELSRLLLATAPLRPVILITGDDDERLAHRALAHGVAAYLLKPFQLFELDAALTQALSLLELVETTEALARSQAGQADDWGEAGGMLPRAWLQRGDEQCSAGIGHGSRVVSVAILLAKISDRAIDARDREVIRTAARTHEVGRLLGPAAPPDLARRSAQLLLDLGFDADVAETVRQAAEPWSPGLSLSARILAVADRLDHDAVEAAARGVDDRDAIRRALDGLGSRAGEALDPGLVGELESRRDQVESMWVLQRQVGPGAALDHPDRRSPGGR